MEDDTTIFWIGGHGTSSIFFNTWKQSSPLFGPSLYWQPSTAVFTLRPPPVPGLAQNERRAIREIFVIPLPSFPLPPRSVYTKRSPGLTCRKVKFPHLSETSQVVVWCDPRVTRGPSAWTDHQQHLVSEFRGKHFDHSASSPHYRRRADSEHMSRSVEVISCGTPERAAVSV